jgi:hypothetical protein
MQTRADAAPDGAIVTSESPLSIRYFVPMGLVEHDHRRSIHPIVLASPLPRLRNREASGLFSKPDLSLRASSLRSDQVLVDCAQVVINGRDRFDLDLAIGNYPIKQ